MASFLFIVNYFLKSDGKPPQWLHESFECLIKAAKYANNEGIGVKILIVTSHKDFDYYSSICEGYSFAHVMRLPKRSDINRFPCIADVLVPEGQIEWLDASGTSSQFIVYANADICVPQYFFHFFSQQIFLNKKLYSGNTSYVVNRKDLVGDDVDPGDADVKNIFMHGGYDCFIFNASIYPLLQLGEVTIGVPPIGAIMKLNLENLSDRVFLYNDTFLTWHRGQDGEWKSGTLDAEKSRNRLAAKIAVQDLALMIGTSPKKLRTPGFENNLIVNYFIKSNLFLRIPRFLKKKIKFVLISLVERLND